MKARLITFEGIDGVGKTTHVALLVEYLKSEGLRVTTYREPGATDLGEELRYLLKRGVTRSALSELLLFCAARAELVTARVRPDLASGAFVVLDRFTDSTLAYQGALGNIPEDALRAVCLAATGGLTPDLTLWLDLDPSQAFERRYPLAEVMDSDAPRAAQLDAIEQRSIGYFTRVRERYAAMALNEPGRYVRIDATGSVEETAQLVRNVVSDHLARWRKQQSSEGETT